MVEGTFLFFGCFFFFTHHPNESLFRETSEKTLELAKICVFLFLYLQRDAHKDCTMWWPLINLEQTDRCTQFEIL